MTKCFTYVHVSVMSTYHYTVYLFLKLRRVIASGTYLWLLWFTLSKSTEVRLFNPFSHRAVQGAVPTSSPLHAVKAFLWCKLEQILRAYYGVQIQLIMFCFINGKECFIRSKTRREVECFNYMWTTSLLNDFKLVSFRSLQWRNDFRNQF